MSIEFMRIKSIKIDILQRLIDKVKYIMQLTELTPEIAHEFIEKIVAAMSEYINGNRYQNIEIYYNDMGIDREPSPEKWKTFQNIYSTGKPVNTLKTAQPQGYAICFASYHYILVLKTYPYGMLHNLRFFLILPTIAAAPLHHNNAWFTDNFVFNHTF